MKGYLNNGNTTSELDYYFNCGYKKAIDDFAEKLHHEEFDNEYGVHITLIPQQVDELAEQLKAGVKNDSKIRQSNKGLV